MLRKLIPHCVIIVSAMYFVFFFIDRVNSAMAFINNGLTKGLLFALCVLAIYESVLLIRDDRRRERMLARRAKAKAGQSSAVTKAKTAARPGHSTGRAAQ